MSKLALSLAGFLLLMTNSFIDSAFAQDEIVQARYGIAVLGGTTYDPEQFPVGLMQAFALFDYDQVFFWHKAPEDLRLRIEVNLGLAGHDGQRAVVAINMLAFKYLDQLGTENWRPYIEGGIGAIYTDFQVDGQGMRVNFNPQAGAGIEWAHSDGHALQAGVRLHHISNAGLHEDNRGVNSVLLMAGWLFP